MTEQPYKFNHIAFPSIGQYRDAIKLIQQNAKYHQVPVPEVMFRGTIKMHGTNAAVVLGLDGEVYAQSRERVITPESDNAGFAAWLHQHKEKFKTILESFLDKTTDDKQTVQIYGEWCGGNIQKGVGLSKLPKMFVIFGVRISEDAESQNWIDINTLRTVTDLYGLPDNTYLNVDFPVSYMSIDFNKPEYAQNSLQELTIEVEQDCPVARKFLPDSTEELIGEGIVWEAVTGDPIGFSVRGLRFKTKGEKHVGITNWVSGIKLKPTDEQKLLNLCLQNNIKDFEFSFCEDHVY